MIIICKVISFVLLYGRFSFVTIKVVAIIIYLFILAIVVISNYRENCLDGIIYSISVSTVMLKCITIYLLYGSCKHINKSQN